MKECLNEESEYRKRRYCRIMSEMETEREIGSKRKVKLDSRDRRGKEKGRDREQEKGEHKENEQVL